MRGTIPSMSPICLEASTAKRNQLVRVECGFGDVRRFARELLVGQQVVRSYLFHKMTLRAGGRLIFHPVKAELDRPLRIAASGRVQIFGSDRMNAENFSIFI